MKFELCERAGLEVHPAKIIYDWLHTGGSGGPVDVIRASEVESMLANAESVKGSLVSEGNNAEWRWHNGKSAESDTFTAKILLIEPIERKCPTCGK